MPANPAAGHGDSSRPTAIRMFVSISNFIDQQLARLSTDHQQKAPEKNLSALDRLFAETLIEVNGPGILVQQPYSHDFNRLQAESE